MNDKLARFEYTSQDEFLADLLLIVKNCQTYNQPDTIFYLYAQSNS